MNQTDTIKDLNKRATKAVAHYWRTLAAQRRRQESGGKADQESCSTVTRGTPIDGFINLFSEVIIQAGIPARFIFREKAAELPGFFQATTKWDLVVVRNNQLLAALKIKSRVGPSFGNDFNNLTEEAIGQAIDFWAAYREEAYRDISHPFLGYFLMLEDCEAFNRPIGVQEPHFKVLQEFADSSEIHRCESFCRKLFLERYYTTAAFITSSGEDGIKGWYKTPAEDLSVDRFIKILAAHSAAWV